MFKQWLEDLEDPARPRGVRFPTRQEVYNQLVRLRHGEESPFESVNNIKYHEKAVEALRFIGMGEEAKELDDRRPTEKDIEVGNRTMSMSLTLGNVLKHKQSQADEEHFHITWGLYMGELDRILDKLEKYL